MENYRKCGIVGCGFVGATCAFTLATSGLFSDMVLLDVNVEKAKGEAMDISHSISFAKPCKVISGDYADLAGCAIVIIAAGANQKPGETRIDLLNRNAKILQSIIHSISQHNPDCILLVVSNPVDILTHMSLKISGFPPERVIGTGTVLDTARLKYLLGRYLKVDTRNVHAFIIGEHGDSELAVWSSANISGVDLMDFCKLQGEAWDPAALHRIYENVRDAAYEIIAGKGATYYGIGMAVLRIVEAIVRDEHSVLPVSTMISGHYDLSGLCLSIPSIIGKNGVERVLDIPLDPAEKKSLLESAEKLQNVLAELQL